ncbi:MAG: hypothetical protein AMJ45_01410 [Syntrophobacter sp. DG_60]|nr:MAG: hypothetical protein AMJ45_01410 [Syntrophobacter sp. DG_60]
MANIMMLLDTSRCIACRACQVACKQWHSLPAEQTNFTGTYQNPPDLSGKNLTLIRFNEFLDKKGMPRWLFFIDRCRHCVTPRCKDACPDGVEITEEGFVVFNHEANPENCRIPMESACPYNIPRFNEDLDQYVKCDFCFDRFKPSAKPITMKNGGKPTTACELACPVGAIFTGDYRTVLGEAVNRLNELRSTYPNANIYFGGYGGIGHVIWLLAEEPTKYNLGTI